MSAVRHRNQERFAVFDVFGIEHSTAHRFGGLVEKLNERLARLERRHAQRHSLPDCDQPSSSQCVVHCTVCETETELVAEIHHLLGHLHRLDLIEPALASLTPWALRFCHALSADSARLAKPSRKLSKPEIRSHELLLIM